MLWWMEAGWKKKEKKVALPPVCQEDLIANWMHLARARLGVDKESINQYQELIARFPQYIMRYIEKICSKLSQSIAFSSGLADADDNRCISMNNFHLLICYCYSAPHRLARNSSSLCMFFLAMLSSATWDDVEAFQATLNRARLLGSCNRRQSIKNCFFFFCSGKSKKYQKLRKIFSRTIGLLCRVMLFCCDTSPYWDSFNSALGEK